MNGHVKFFGDNLWEQYRSWRKKFPKKIEVNCIGMWFDESEEKEVLFIGYHYL